MGENKFRIRTVAIVAGVVALSVSSCDLNSKMEQQEQTEIQDYLTAHPNLNYTKEPSGLYYLVDVRGTGDSALKKDTARVIYTGYYIDGTEFSTNVGSTDTLVFAIGGGQMIAGFDEAVSYMRTGGKSDILCPSSLAYGETGYLMPAYTPLLFDIYLVRLTTGSKE
ncbi:MAG: FKBP-type peptidyl-prolyl cis-trans isomerase [Bacteroidales bacterium]|jgi:FKBP-type peptidyl-prolyl cis-trans isomerase